MGLRAYSSDGSGETKISYFVDNFSSLLLLEKDVLGLYVSVNEIFLMDALQSFEYFD